MGSTRFMKVARANSPDGAVVVKVFVIHDASVPVHEHKQRCQHITTVLSSVANCLPFSDIMLLDKCALLVRQHIRYSLYDRVSTRPLLSRHDKLWLSFQLLQCLSHCHSAGVCHGDLKLENLLVTSSLWLMVADWASYKPALLPDDNPADFGYFFDTSRRRICYLAPERFVSSATGAPSASTADVETDVCHDAPSSTSLNDGVWSMEDCVDGSLTPAMDVFGVGCCLIELWTDGDVVPFHLPQLLTFRSDSTAADLYRIRGCLQRQVDEHVLQLLMQLISADACARGTLANTLRHFTPLVFPATFGDVLHPYLRQMNSLGRQLSADQMLLQLANDAEKLLASLASVSSCGQVSSGDISLLLGVVTSCVRRLFRLDVKLACIALLVRLCECLPESASDSTEIVVDRVLPYVLWMTHDKKHRRVRIAALRAVTRLLELAEKLSASFTSDSGGQYGPSKCDVDEQSSSPPPSVDRAPPLDSAGDDAAALMMEYVLPAVAVLAQDPDVGVRRCYASQIPLLAGAVMRRLVSSHRRSPRPALSVEISSLHRLVQQQIQQLLADGDPAVRRILLVTGFRRLCVFFGRHRAADLLLSHMVTFLNDNGDRALRLAFFQTVDCVAAVIGRHCVPPLTPLLLQGLADSDELVAAGAVDALTRLAQAGADNGSYTGGKQLKTPANSCVGLLSMDAVQMALSEMTPLMLHPSLWLRHAVVGFISVCASRMSSVDVHCRLLPSTLPVLTAAASSAKAIDQAQLAPISSSLVDLTRCESLLALLTAPVRRSVFDTLLRASHLLRPLLDVLSERQRVRQLTSGGLHDSRVPSRTSEVSVAALITRLESDGMDECVEEQLLLLSNHLLKIQQQRHSASVDVHQADAHDIADNSVLCLDNVDSEIVNVISLETNNGEISGQLQSSPSALPPEIDQPVKNDTAPAFLPLLSSETNMAPCRRALDALVRRLLLDKSTVVSANQQCSASDQTAANSSSVSLSAAAAAGSSCWDELPAGWKPRGQLVAHLHEHQGAVVRLAAVPDSSLFLSGATDGHVKLWDAARMESRGVTNRSVRTIKRQLSSSTPAALTALSYCRWRRVVAAADSSGALWTAAIDGERSEPTLLTELSRANVGCVAEIAFIEPHCLIYATDFGKLVRWDMRTRDEDQTLFLPSSSSSSCAVINSAWSVQNPIRHGLLTAVCVDPSHYWLTAGTSSGIHVCWDLRFLLPVATLRHPFGARVRRLVAHPSQQSWFVSAVSGNSQVDMWNIETAERQMTLWSGAGPVLTADQRDRHSVCALHVPPCCPAGSGGRSHAHCQTDALLFTAGTDMCCRLWRLSRPSRSQLLTTAGLQLSHQQLSAAVSPPAAESALTAAVTSSCHTSYRSQVVDGIEVIQEQRYTRSLTPSVSASDNTPCPRGPPAPAPGHLDTISDVITTRGSQWLFVTSARDGVIKVWK